MKDSINEVLEQRKNKIISKDSLVNKIWMEVWDKVVSGRHITFRPRSVDRVIERVKVLPFVTYCYDYKFNVVKQLENDPEAVKTLSDFMVNSSDVEFDFFIAQMNNDGDTAWFAKKYLFDNEQLHETINKIIADGQIEKVKTLFAFAFDDDLDLRLTETTHPNSFSAYAEGQCNGEMSSFLDKFLNYNAIILNDYLTEVQDDCLNYTTAEQFYEQINFYNGVKRFDFDEQIKVPMVLYKSFLTFKKLNESKVWGTDEKFSVNKFAERDQMRRKYDDFSYEQESKVQKLVKETVASNNEKEIQ